MLHGGFVMRRWVSLTVILFLATLLVGVVLASPPGGSTGQTPPPYGGARSAFGGAPNGG
jgi:hypothetical protein